MDRTQIMLERLGSTGLYNTGSDTQVYAETSAWAEGIRLVEEEIDDILSEMFIPDAEGRGLEIYESNMKLPLNGESAVTRREAIMAALSVSDKEYPPLCADKLSLMCGTDIDIEESSGGDLIFRLDSSLSADRRNEISVFLERFVPMGVSYQIL